jgi:hypothetical protein
MKKEVGRFVAKSATGKKYTIHVWGTMIDTSTMHGPDSAIGGMTELVLDDGSHVNRLDHGYQIVATGEILTSDDPNAV